MPAPLKNDWTSGDSFTATDQNTVANAVNAQAAVARQTNASTTAERNTYWRNKADTSSPSTTEDTGQTAAYSQAGAFPFIVSGGKLTFAPTSGSNVAAYRTFQASGNATRTGIRFTFNKAGRSTDGGAINLSVMNDTLANASLTSFRIAMHLVIGPTIWQLQKVSNATGALVFTTVAAGYYNKPLAQDGVSIYQMDTYRVGSTITLCLPDGSVRSFTDTDFSGWAGPHGFSEVFCANGTTDSIPAIVETWVDTGAQYPPTDQYVTQSQASALTLPGEWGPQDSGWLGWAYDPASCYQGVALTAGFLFLIGIPIRTPMTITNVIANVWTAGATLTAGQNKASLYQNTVLLAATADQTSAWGSTGLKTMALTAPQVVQPGIVYVGLHANGTTPPQFSVAVENLAGTPYLSNAGSVMRHGYDSGHSGITTTPPSPIGAIATHSPFWAAVS